jgi:hypothetical protein
MAKGELPGPAPQPNFVQLLSPDGERVDHPDYDVDFTDEEYRRLVARIDPLQTWRLCLSVQVTPRIKKFGRSR